MNTKRVISGVGCVVALGWCSYHVMTFSTWQTDAGCAAVMEYHHDFKTALHYQEKAIRESADEMHRDVSEWEVRKPVAEQTDRVLAGIRSANDPKERLAYYWSHCN
jgi:hypothetical protein